MIKGTLFQQGVEYLHAIYIIEVDDRYRHVAEWTGVSWLPLGCDYDPWQYDKIEHKIRMLAIVSTADLELIIL